MAICSPTVRSFCTTGRRTTRSWLRDALSKNKPYDQFARELLTSSGGTYQALPTNFYTVQKKPEDMATFVSQAFLGVSLECARCHDHPSEKWKRDDFMGLAAFFSQVKFKGGARNNERFLYIDPEKEFVHPQTKLSVAAKFLGADYCGISTAGRPTGKVGRVADVSQQSLLCEGGCQPLLERVHGTRHRRTRGRFSRDESAQSPGVAGAPGG